MRRPQIVIVGAGLGGSILANFLLDTHDVTLIERGNAVVDLRYPVVDIGRPAKTAPHFGAGPGGSTQLWHNGLIEIDEEIFDRFWPIRKSDLDRYYQQAFQLLSFGVPRARVVEAIEELRKKYQALGLPGQNLPGLYYPRWPMNVWEHLKLDGRVRLLRGNVTGFEHQNGRITALSVTEGDRTHTLAADAFVLSAGGLGTPILLQHLADSLPLQALKHAGYHYEDHPMGFVGEVELATPLYQLWNHNVPGTGGNLRLPLVVTQNGMQISFQLRPAASYHRNRRRDRVGSVLHKLRQNPWNPINYLGLLSHWDDILDILSFKLGIRLPTKKYTLLMMAQMPPSEDCSLWGEGDERESQRRIRRWTLTEEYRQDLSQAIDTLLAQLRPVTRHAHIFPEWFSELATGAHHSGMARMSQDPATGVCDSDCKVHGLENLYVCDGSVIPASGVANTGLTICALAIRLSARLRRSLPSNTPAELAEP